MKITLFLISLLVAAAYSSSAWVQAGEATPIKTIETTTETTASGFTSMATATTKTNADGSTTTTTTHSDGLTYTSTSKTNSDGSTTTTKTNSDGSTFTYTSTTKENADGSTTTTKRDDRFGVTVTSTSTKVQIFSDGSSVVKQPDGKIVFYNPGEGPYALDLLLHPTASQEPIIKPATSLVDDLASPPTPSTPQWGGLTPSLDILDKSLQDLIDQADNHSSGTPRPSAGTLATNPGYGPTYMPPPLMPGNVGMPGEFPPGGIPWEISPSGPGPMPPGDFPWKMPPMKK